MDDADDGAGLLMTVPAISWTSNEGEPIERTRHAALWGNVHIQERKHLVGRVERMSGIWVAQPWYQPERFTCHETRAEALAAIEGWWLAHGEHELQRQRFQARREAHFAATERAS
jgi:hypothetical protein